MAGRRLRLGNGLDLVMKGGAILRVRPGSKGLPLLTLHESPAGPATMGARFVSRGKPGRRPSPETLKLRALIQRHLAQGELREPMYYARRLAKSTGSSLASAAQTAHRELRAARKA
jgi:hypothetical protein